MDKLTLAHEYVKTILSMNNACHTMDDAVNIGWQYADLMYAEQEKRTDKTRPAVLDEFQVDWNFAPKWANWWLMQSDGSFHFVGVKPFFDGSLWFTGTDVEWLDAPSFNYQGDWKSSLQERK